MTITSSSNTKPNAPLLSNAVPVRRQKAQRPSRTPRENKRRRDRRKSQRMHIMPSNHRKVIILLAPLAALCLSACGNSSVEAIKPPPEKLTCAGEPPVPEGAITDAVVGEYLVAQRELGRELVGPPVTNEHLLCRLLRDTNN